MLHFQELSTYIKTDPEWLSCAHLVESYTAKDDPKFGCDHGFYHWVTVANTAYDLTLMAGYGERMATLAKIAGLLHDWGLILGDDNHATHSAALAETYLRTHFGNNNPLSNTEIDVICHAIAHHSDGEELTHIVDAAVLFADKVHVCSNRINDACNSWLHEAVKIKRVSFSLTNSFLILNYQTREDFNPKVFFSNWPKTFDAPARVAHFLGRNFKLFLNGNRYLPITNTAP